MRERKERTCWPREASDQVVHRPVDALDSEPGRLVLEALGKLPACAPAVSSRSEVVGWCWADLGVCSVRPTWLEEEEEGALSIRIPGREQDDRAGSISLMDSDL